MIRAEGSRGNRVEAAPRTPNGNGEVVKGGFLEKTPDLHFGRLVRGERRSGAWREKRNRASKSQGKRHTVCLGSCRSSLWTEGSGEGKAELEERKDLGSRPLPPLKCPPQWTPHLAWSAFCTISIRAGLGK